VRIHPNAEKDLDACMDCGAKNWARKVTPDGSVYEKCQTPGCMCRRHVGQRDLDQKAPGDEAPSP
jgi:hypothetical protein